MKMNSWFLFFWLVLIVLVVSQSFHNSKEGFTPKVRSIYRPYMRKMRLTVESYTNKYNSDYLLGFLRKFGLY